MSDIFETLLDSVVNTDELETEYRVCPEVDAPATVKKAELKTGQSEKLVSPSNSQGIWANLKILWELDSEEARQEMQRDDVVVSQSIFLSVKDDETGNPQLSTAQNQELAKLLKLFDISGTASLQEILDGLHGQLAFVSVKQKPYKDKMVAEVAAVTEA